MASRLQSRFDDGISWADEEHTTPLISGVTGNLGSALLDNLARADVEVREFASDLEPLFRGW